MLTQMESNKEEKITAQYLKNIYDTDLAELQKNCKHDNQSPELPYYWAAGHSNGTAIQCNDCWKILKHNAESFEFKIATNEK